MADEEYQINTELDRKTGIWYATCPICGRAMSGATESGTFSRTLEHMNAAHGGKNQ